jgi:hypothetical protein
MSVDLQYALSTDGAFDRSLKFPVEWAIQHLTDISFSGDWVDPRVIGASTLEQKLAGAAANYACDLLFVHRDAERAVPADRKAEIENALRIAGVGTHHVAVVPIRMTEAWLLIDELAIRTAAGNPNGTMSLPLPKLSALEREADPKITLETCLERASGKSGRRLSIFRRDMPAMKHRVAELIETYEPLLSLSSFSALVEDTKLALMRLGHQVKANRE